MTEIFNTLNGVNVNEHTEKKNGLTYLSWAWAWSEVKKIYPDTRYEIKMFDGKPYCYDEDLGYMVMTSVTINDLTYEMWLPVMDSNNKAMKKEPYTVKTRYKEITVEAATMFDVNKAIMRCLVKNLAMFGLGIYIYSGEDLPEEEVKAKAEARANAKEPIPYEAKPKACEECGQVITATVDKKGNEISAAEVARLTKKKSGRRLCSDCMKAVSAK